MAETTATIIPQETQVVRVSSVPIGPVSRTIGASKQAQRLQSVDYIGEGESLVQTCKRRCIFGRRITVQPECLVVAFDLSFFFMFLVGNIITAIWNPGFYANNPIINYFKTNNICVGIDTYPARYAAIPTAVVSFVLFYLCCFLFFKRMWDEDRTERNENGELVRIHDKSKWCRSAVLVLALLFYSCFSFAVSIDPSKPHGFRMHFLGFQLGLIGYGFLKVSSILEFFFFISYGRHVNGLRHNFTCQVKNCRTLTFLITEFALCITLWFCGLMFSFPTHKMWNEPDDVLEAQMTNNTWGPPTVGQLTGFKVNSASSWLASIMLLGPFISLFVAPKSREVEVEFHYNVAEVQNEDVFQVCCCTIAYSKHNLCIKPFACCGKGYTTVKPDPGVNANP